MYYTPLLTLFFFFFLFLYVYMQWTIEDKLEVDLCIVGKSIMAIEGVTFDWRELVFLGSKSVYIYLCCILCFENLIVNLASRELIKLVMFYLYFDNKYKQY